MLLPFLAGDLLTAIAVVVTQSVTFLLFVSWWLFIGSYKRIQSQKKSDFNALDDNKCQRFSLCMLKRSYNYF
ncbi:MAG: hypothetical protein D6160_18070 [Ketobacter sp.]|nr:MAG: hypothetical protein D6160_18070 [Ketobacter sp.]